MSSRKLSIVTICFRNLAGLRKTIESLLDQTCHDFEQWVIDGGSDDGTVEYLQNLKVPWNLKWISEKDKGIYDAMNKGTARASGDYIWYLNSGDYAADPKVIEDLIQAIQSHAQENVDLLYGKTYFESEVGRRVVGRKVKASDFSVSMPVSHPGMIFKRDQVQKRGYKTTYRLISDWILVRSMFEDGCKAVFINRVFATFDLSGISSVNHWLDVREKLQYEQSLRGKLRVLIWCGGRYALIWLGKKMGIFKYWKRLRYSHAGTNSK